jgi:hypothetical protein
MDWGHHQNPIGSVNQWIWLLECLEASMKSPLSLMQ